MEVETICAFVQKNLGSGTLSQKISKQHHTKLKKVQHEKPFSCVFAYVHKNERIPVSPVRAFNGAVSVG